MGTELSDNEILRIAHRRWGLSLKKTSEREYHSPCPVCGGEDRFMVFSDSGFYCRQCEYKGWLNDDQIRWKPNPEQDRIYQERLFQKRKERDEKEKAWLEGFQAGCAWHKWHTEMREENIKWWLSQGIKEHQIKQYELGYLAEKQIEAKEGTYILSAYTIPIMDINTADVVNVHYRLVDPPVGVGKYRYERGVRAREFYASLGESSGAIVVEGAKKAMVLHDFIDGKMQVIGLPGNTPSQDIMERIKKFDPVYLALDPGCRIQEARIKHTVAQARIITLPGKVDDLIMGGMNVGEFRAFVRQSRP